MKTEFETLAVLAGRLSSEGRTPTLEADLEAYCAMQGKSARELAKEFFEQTTEASEHLRSVGENQDERESLFEKIAETNGEEPIDVGDYMDDLSLEVSVNAALASESTSKASDPGCPARLGGAFSCATYLVPDKEKESNT